MKRCARVRSLSLQPLINRRLNARSRVHSDDHRRIFPRARQGCTVTVRFHHALRARRAPARNRGWRTDVGEWLAAGPTACGSITGVYTVLVEGDNMNEPVADEVRSILDGHIILSRALAERHH